MRPIVVLNTVSPRRILGSLALVLCAAVPNVAAPAESFHLALKRSDPSKDSVLAKAPNAIKLWFTEKPEVAVTSISIVDANAAKVELTAPRIDAADATAVIADVKIALGPGAYRVHWKTSSHDGHPIRGEFGFTVKATK